MSARQNARLAQVGAPRAKSLASPREEAANVVSKLSKLYRDPEWTLLTEVRTTTGCPEGLRSADALAINLWPSSGTSLVLHGVEVKLNRSDWLRERKQPEKSGPFKVFCAAWYLVVPMPWKRVVMSTSELPDRWGLIEVGTGAPSIVVQAEEREAEDPTPGFMRALLRAASRAAALREDPDADAPLQPVTRPTLSRHHIGLGCGHVAPRPLAKVMPPRVPCLSCLADHPTDRELVLAALEDAGAEDLRHIATALEGRRPW